MFLLLPSFFAFFLSFLLLLLSRFSRVRLCADHHTGCPVPGILQARTLEWAAISSSNAWKWSEREVTRSSPTLSDPRDCSPPGSSVPGIFQARALEWGATAFSLFPSAPNPICLFVGFKKYFVAVSWVRNLVGVYAHRHQKWKVPCPHLLYPQFSGSRLRLSFCGKF